MPTKLAMVQGQLYPIDKTPIPADDPGFTVGWSVFDTFEIVDGQIAPERLELHLQRLAASCTSAAIPPPPPAVLRDEAQRLAGNTRGRWKVRITISGSGLRVLTAQPISMDRRGKPVRAARGIHHQDPYMPGSIKHGSRGGWVTALRRSGMDEILLVDEEDRFTEGTTSGIIAIIDGALWTAPHDGSILESTSVITLIDKATAMGIPVVRERPTATGPWDGLYIASSTRHLAPVCQLDGVPLKNDDPVGKRLSGP